MYKRILVLADGSETSNQALDAAIRLAAVFNSRVRVLHVLEESAWMTGYDLYTGANDAFYQAFRQWGEELLEKALAKVKAAGVDADMMLVDRPGLRFGEAVAHAAVAWKADLIVTGTHGRKGVGRALMGSGAEQVIRLAPVPVLVIRDGAAALPADAAREAAAKEAA